MDVLNSIKVTIPPELREMLLEFVVCYLIDRPTDPHSYAASHFLYQQKLRHSYVVRYPYSGTKKAEALDDAVQTEVTPEVSEERLFREQERLFGEQEQPELAADTVVEPKRRKQAVPKTVRIADDVKPLAKKEEAVEAVEEVVETAEDVAEVISEAILAEVSQDLHKAKSVDECSLTVATKSALQVVDAAMAVVEQAAQPEEKETVESEQKLSARAIAARSVVEVVHSAYQSLRNVQDEKPEGVEYKGRPSAKAVAARSVVEVVHSAYQSLRNVQDEKAERVEHKGRLSARTVAARSVVDLVHTAFQSLKNLKDEKAGPKK